ncbi:hypothetical protein BB559_007536 [Furculomyces boomerangus]|uniref:Chloride channel protein n=2 Tax=Harpellales TaxID=61421 RepID=A0A2T9XWZ2_9FUNG|nr:hypothetical protein BB559_007536 [Furculomyces boomerangus]PWA03544.1 hypothetical protein BB558_000224 [Smittium angustum]
MTDSKNNYSISVAHESTKLLGSIDHTPERLSPTTAYNSNINNHKRRYLPRAKSLENNALSKGVEVWQYLKKTRDKKTGERLWYESYTTIDWLEDAQKEQSRLRTLSKKDKWYSFIDKLEDWSMPIIVGILCGITAGFISQWTELLSGFKVGYCKGNWKLEKHLCKNNWTTWKDALGSDFNAYIMFCLIGVLLSGVASQLVLRNPTMIPKLSRNTPKNKEPVVDTNVRVAYYGAGSGIPEVKTILSGFVIHGFLGLKILLVKSFGLILAVSSGIMVGKEGPMVHIASCIGNISTRIYSKFGNNESRKRKVISASAAAGVSVAFGAPIGGVLFSLEEVSYYFSHSTMLYSFLCALVAAITLRAYDPLGTGKIVMFQVYYDHNYSWVEIPFFFILGIFGGIWGAFYNHLNSSINKFRRKSFLSRFGATEVFFVTLLTLMISYHNPATRMGLGQMVGDLFQECNATNDTENSIFCVGGNNTFGHVLKNLAVALVVRGSLAIITFGIKVPSGLVLPSMSIGAIFGRLVGTFVEHAAEELNWSFLPKCDGKSGYCVTPGVYALVGAGATLTGATRTTISVAVIMFELTESLTYTLPVMIAIITAKLVADAWNPSSIYEMIMSLAGYPFLDTTTNYIFNKQYASELVNHDSPFISIDQINTISVLTPLIYEIMQEGYGDVGVAIVNQNMKLVGCISCVELSSALLRIADWPPETEVFFEKKCGQLTVGSSSGLNDFSYLVNQAPLSVKSKAPVELVNQLFTQLGISYLCVEENNKFYGLISKKNFIAYLDELEEKGMVY